MKASEFYQKYWRIETKDGQMLPPQLNEGQARFLDDCAESNKMGLTAENTTDADFEIIEPKQIENKKPRK